MTIRLNHTIIPSNDKDASARFIAEVLGLAYDGPGYFAAVPVNDDLTLDFVDAGHEVRSHHFAFAIDSDDFDAIFDRIRSLASQFGSSPRSSDDGQINQWSDGGCNVYFVGGPDPHLWEIMVFADAAAA